MKKSLLLFITCLALPIISWGQINVSITASGTLTFCAGDTVSLSSNTSGSVSIINYQWLRNSIPINNANTPSYSASFGGHYALVVIDSSSNGITIDTSNIITLQMFYIEKPTISPKNNVICSNSTDSVTLNVKALVDKFSLDYNYSQGLTDSHNIYVQPGSQYRMLVTGQWQQFYSSGSYSNGIPLYFQQYYPSQGAVSNWIFAGSTESYFTNCLTGNIS